MTDSKMTDFRKLEAAQKEIYFESKLNLVPASIREIYSNISKTETLVARELIVNDRVVIGIEYSPEGLPALAYTTDKTGKHIPLDRPQKSPSKAAHTPADLISERLVAVSKTLAHQAETAQNTPPAASQEKARMPKKNNNLSLNNVRRVKKDTHSIA